MAKLHANNQAVYVFNGSSYTTIGTSTAAAAAVSAAATFSTRKVALASLLEIGLIPPRTLQAEGRGGDVLAHLALRLA